MTATPDRDRHFPLAAFLSAVLPGLGQAVKHEPARAAAIALTGAALLSLVWTARSMAGAGFAVFVLLVVVLPWWIIQSYDAFLPSASGAASLRRTMRIALERAHDIRFLGWLFLLTAGLDLYIIVINPEYALTILCAKPDGPLGLLVKAQSPALHVLIGWGFLRLRRWALRLYLAYAGFGLLNATANFTCFGYGRVRTVFLLSLLGFTAYVWRRRTAFYPNDVAESGL
jgi:hypothetical protein